MPPRAKTAAIFAPSSRRRDGSLAAPLMHVTYTSWQDTAPDVVYAFTPSVPMAVAISTCGSAFDTVLMLTTDPNDVSTFQHNDDDRTCAESSSSSRLDVSLSAGTPYFVIVSGYKGDSGPYVLTLDCTSCDTLDV